MYQCLHQPSVHAVQGTPFSVGPLTCLSSYPVTQSISARARVKSFQVPARIGTASPELVASLRSIIDKSEDQKGSSLYSRPFESWRSWLFHVNDCSGKPIGASDASVIMTQCPFRAFCYDTRQETSKLTLWSAKSTWLHSRSLTNDVTCGQHPT